MRSKKARFLASLLLLWAPLAAAGVVEVKLGVLPASPAVGVAAGAQAQGVLASPASALGSLELPAPAVGQGPVAPSALAPASAESGALAVARGVLSPAQALSTEFPGVSFQNEQEGNLFHGDARDSSGDVFAYYRPAELRGELLEAARARMSGLERFGVALKTLRGWLTRGDPLKAWDALPRTGKAHYLGMLEEAVAAERGPGAVWNGKRFLLLQKSPAAPDFVADHPDMEEPPGALREGLGSRFLQPEIVSHRGRAARTPAEALARTRRVIAETGHAGTQVHAFVTLPTGRLLAALPALAAAVQAANDVLFLEAAIESPDNLLHGSLRPWHAGRSERARALVQEAGASPNQPRWDDPDSEKHAFVGLRYWGTRAGQATVSLELRGASLPWRRPPGSGRGIEGAGVPEPRRDYAPLERALGQLALIADRLRNGGLGVEPEAPVVLDADAAARTLSALSAERGAPPVSAADLAALSEALGGGPGVHPALLYPLALGRSGAYGEELWRQALRLKAHGPEFNARLARYSLWTEFAVWARERLPAARSRLDAIAR